MESMARTSEPAIRNGLHCVYGTCRGLPCNPGCSFTMTTMPDADLTKALLEGVGSRFFQDGGRTSVGVGTHPPSIDSATVACVPPSELDAALKLGDEPQESLTAACLPDPGMD